MATINACHPFSVQLLQPKIPASVEYGVQNARIQPTIGLSGSDGVERPRNFSHVLGKAIWPSLYDVLFVDQLDRESIPCSYSQQT